MLYQKNHLKVGLNDMGKNIATILFPKILNIDIHHDINFPPLMEKKMHFTC